MKKALMIFNCLSSPVVLPKPNLDVKGWKKRMKKAKPKIRKRRKVKKVLVTPEYKTYIKSEAWNRRRNQYYSRNRRECVICKSNHLIGLHHMTYQNLGREKDEDLVALCWLCHERYHEEYSKGNLFKQTQEYIIENQQIREFSQIVKNL